VYEKSRRSLGCSRTHTHSHSVFCGLAKNQRTVAQACLPAGRELGSGTSENVGRVKNGQYSVRVLSHPHSLSLCILWPRQESTHSRTGLPAGRQGTWIWNLRKCRESKKWPVFGSGTLAPTLTLTLYFVASPRIELGSGASETLILSIVLRGRGAKVIFRR